MTNTVYPQKLKNKKKNKQKMTIVENLHMCVHRKTRGHISEVISNLCSSVLIAVKWQSKLGNPNINLGTFNSLVLLQWKVPIKKE